jgi:hypothetical protein
VRERRRHLTPLESELTASQDRTVPGQRSLRERLRRKKRPPTTWAGAVAQGLIRLGITVGVASGVAVAVNHWVDRGTAFGFYIVGAALLAVAFGLSAADFSTPHYYGRGERERRVSMSFSYILAGAVVVGIGVAIDFL